MKKVISVGIFPLYHKDIPMYYPGTDYFFLFGYGQFIAKEFKKRNYPVVFEIWRMDLRIDSIMEKEVDGILCRIFPSKKVPFFKEMSGEMVKALRTEAKSEDVVFHFIPNRLSSFFYFASIVKKHKVVATHIGEANPYWKFKHERKWKSFIWYLLEKYILLIPFNTFIALSEDEVSYYKRVNKEVIQMPFFGIARQELFVIEDRTKSRVKLGLPLNKNILLQVGRGMDDRGFDWIMSLIDYYKDKDDYFLIFVGVDKEDEYYNRLKETSVFMIPYLDHALLSDYYNAADLLYYLPHGKMDLEFAGTSSVPLEALACGTPVVATTFHHFPDEEVSTVSRIPKCEEDVIPMIEDLLSANVSRQKCRDIVLKAYSWDTVIKRHWKIYNNESL